MLRTLLIALMALCAALALTAAHAQPTAPTQITQLYLPMIGQATGPPATVRFGTGLSGGVLSGAATTFPAGLPALYYEISITDGEGQPFRLEWTIDGVRRPELDRDGLVPAAGAPVTGGIARSTGDPLPQGVYALRIYVGGLPSGQGQARIE